MHRFALRRTGAIVLVLAAGLALAGCLLSPGRFTSTLDLRQDGRFSFTYAGEISLLGLSKLANREQAGESEAFTPTPCYADETGEERPCTKAETADQRKNWEADNQARSERKAREAEQMKAVLGGIDPNDAKSIDELVQRLRRQAGWRKVDYKGDGLFVVDYALSGVLTHDFRFPSMERMPMANAFVELVVRADGSVRIDAPGFGPAAGGGAYRGLMQMAAMDKGKEGLALPELDGTFTVTTDGEVLANNTENGPQADPAGKRMAWRVTADSQSAPMVLVKLTR